ncbi:26442_t:CDS:1 [Dentiscutata erythropus]|uniref:26442_t:CDS:1 n=1 Tax=Dentiscutata erythropus TaxID=1348616 RepID=A0A9N8ZTJ8_9GLOM|nr:26442_t:CDS:1 [Dentiscutata erythropus]
MAYKIRHTSRRMRLMNLRVLAFTLIIFIFIIRLPSVITESVNAKEPASTISTKSQEDQIEYYKNNQTSEHCPYIQELNRQKKSRLNIENNFTKQIFAFLFPGSPRVNSILATFYISSIPNFILYFVPPDIKPSSLNSLVSFAVGGLLGDVFLHLLPHSFLGETTDDEVHFVQVEEKKNVVIGLAIFVGLTTFYVIDKLMRVINGGEGGHSHDHDNHNHKDFGSSTSHKSSSNDISSSTLRQRKSTVDKTMDEKPATKTPSTSIKLSAYLNLFADFTHNVTDGLAMAASFYTSPSIGATTTVAVFFHEIPHEIGDYAILIQSGFTKRRAMLSQFITAIGAFLGTFIGIMIEEISRGEHHTAEILSSSDEGFGILGTGVVLGDLVIPFTAGGFLYIATVGVIPELLKVTGNFVKDLKQACIELLAMLIGVGMMAVIAWNEG